MVESVRSAPPIPHPIRPVSIDGFHPPDETRERPTRAETGDGRTASRTNFCCAAVVRRPRRDALGSNWSGGGVRWGGGSGGSGGGAHQQVVEGPDALHRGGEVAVHPELPAAVLGAREERGAVELVQEAGVRRVRAARGVPAHDDAVEPGQRRAGRVVQELVPPQRLQRLHQPRHDRVLLRHLRRTQESEAMVSRNLSDKCLKSYEPPTPTNSQGVRDRVRTGPCRRASQRGTEEGGLTRTRPSFSLM
eukprot:1181308-Prorocentrum_minimum.AAC.1